MMVKVLQGDGKEAVAVAIEAKSKTSSHKR